MLGWLEYSIRKVLGIEGDSKEVKQEGTKRVAGTICKLKNMRVKWKY